MVNVIKYIVVFGCLLPFCVFAGLSNVTLEGIIVKYDKNTVTLSQRGKRITVSRKNIPKHFKLKTRKKVYAILNSEEVMKEIKKIRKQIRNKNRNRNKKNLVN